MADNTDDRRNDARLDASISVLGDDGNGKEPAIDRVGPAPRPEGSGDMEEEMQGGHKAPGDGNLDLTSERAAKEAIGDEAARFGKS